SHQLTNAAHVVTTAAKHSPHSGRCVRRKRTRKMGLSQAAAGMIHLPLDTTSSSAATANNKSDRDCFPVAPETFTRAAGFGTRSAAGKTLVDWLMALSLIEMISSEDSIKIISA
ncbi:MAG: hypothetical protein ACREC4_09485, partial [Methylocella sp.]